MVGKRLKLTDMSTEKPGLWSVDELDGFAPEGENEVGSLLMKYVIPPFTVLDVRQGYWQERKRQWLSLGIQSELGRGENLLGEGANSLYTGKSEWAGVKGPKKVSSRSTPPHGPKVSRDPVTGKLIYEDPQGHPSRRANAAPSARPFPLGKQDDGSWTRGNFHEGRRLTYAAGNRPIEELDEVSRKIIETTGSGTSIFDPVLCEIAYRWYCPQGGRVLDPFAGGSVRGVVASVLGLEYHGVDLNPQQILANEIQGRDLCGTCAHLPRWHHGDSREVQAYVEFLDSWPNEYDMIMSCPPYADLEVYTDDPRDLSQLDYPEFLRDYRLIIEQTAELLKPGRFAFWVVGDLRDQKTGTLRDFPGDTIRAFEDAGMKLWNDHILVTSVGSVPIRVSNQFSVGRKAGRCHQLAYVFVKGDPKEAVQACGHVGQLVEWKPTHYVPTRCEQKDEPDENSAREPEPDSSGPDAEWPEEAGSWDAPTYDEASASLFDPHA